MSIAITEQSNYAAYGVEELEDVLENIDKQAFPERYQAAKNELAAKRALPYTLHLASGKQETELKFAYEKGSGSKHCRHSLLLKESGTLSDGRLCLNQSEHKRLPNKGWVYVKGSESGFGFDIEGYRFR
ncbi:hypothetical protein [Alteromonas macleodii]|uniref:hypothetical protein n=1 Tax=Alteromonas macleodii TaxID=28108 RepID=UPI00066BA3E8|nr:hypothetical protein [Alteromonas macleodii]CAI3968118.1 hypothetical protein MIT1002_03663 [Alteromonas macleodii]VTP55835.1 hypothetical protein MIT1002_03663 [Alteromonas macleodii]